MSLRTPTRRQLPGGPRAVHGGITTTSCVKVGREDVHRPPSSPPRCAADRRRAATRGRSAPEGGDKRVGVEERFPFARQPREQIEQESGQPHRRKWLSAEPHRPRGLDDRFACALGRLRRRHDAPLIGERSATRDRVETEGGEEQADAKTIVRRPKPPFRPGVSCALMYRSKRSISFASRQPAPLY